MGRGVILVLCDGLGDAAARVSMGFMEHMVLEGRASRFTSLSSLPTNSRPNYETLHTGVVPSVHGVTSNLVARSSNRPNTFSMAVGSGLTTAAVAYSWFSELYVRSPFDPSLDTEVIDPSGFINNGRFYFTDEEPDQEIFARAATVIGRYQPSYVLIHPMGCDLAGHAHGGRSGQYAAAIELQDALLATAVPAWTAAGYVVMVTSDHGHRPDGGHGGTEPEVVETPLYVVPASGSGLGDTGQVVPNTRVAPTAWNALGVGGIPEEAAGCLEVPF